MRKVFKNLLIFSCIIIISVLLIKIWNIDKKILRKIYPDNYKEYVKEYSKLYNVDESIIFAIIKSESNFRKDVVSNKGAKGLMQIIDSTAKEVALKLELEGKTDLINPQINIQLGTKFFSTLYKKYNNIGLALAAYNAGSGNVDKWIRNGVISKNGDNIENIPYKETNMYVRKVLQISQIYKEIYY